MGHIADIKESCHPRKHRFQIVTHMNESCHMYGCVIWHIWMRHDANMNESCHTYKYRFQIVIALRVLFAVHRHFVVCTVNVSHVTETNSSYRTYARVMSHVCMKHGARMHESCHVSCDEFTCEFMR